MSTIFWSALSVLLREPGGEEGVTALAAQGPARGGVGDGVLAQGSCSLKTLKERNAATSVSGTGSVQHFHQAWALQAQGVRGLEQSQQAAYRNWSRLGYCIAPAETMVSASSSVPHCRCPARVGTN